MAIPAPSGVKASATSTTVDVTFAAVTATITAPSWNALPSGETTTATAFSFTHPGMPAGSHAIAVADKGNVTIVGYAAYTVTAAPAAVESTTGVKAYAPVTIIGSDGTKWSINDLGVVTVNGVPDATTYNVVEVGYYQPNHQVWHKNTTGQTYYKVKSTDKSWTEAAAPSGVF